MMENLRNSRETSYGRDCKKLAEKGAEKYIDLIENYCKSGGEIDGEEQAEERNVKSDKSDQYARKYALSRTLIQLQDEGWTYDKVFGYDDLESLEKAFPRRLRKKKNSLENSPLWNRLKGLFNYKKGYQRRPVDKRLNLLKEDPGSKDAYDFIQHWTQQFRDPNGSERDLNLRASRWELVDCAEKLQQYRDPKTQARAVHKDGTEEEQTLYNHLKERGFPEAGDVYSLRKIDDTWLIRGDGKYSNADLSPENVEKAERLPQACITWPQLSPRYLDHLVSTGYLTDSCAGKVARVLMSAQDHPMQAMESEAVTIEERFARSLAKRFLKMKDERYPAKKGSQDPKSRQTNIRKFAGILHPVVEFEFQRDAFPGSSAATNVSSPTEDALIPLRAWRPIWENDVDMMEVENRREEWLEEHWEQYLKVNLSRESTENVGSHLKKDDSHSSLQNKMVTHAWDVLLDSQKDRSNLQSCMQQVMRFAGGEEVLLTYNGKTDARIRSLPPGFKESVESVKAQRSQIGVLDCAEYVVKQGYSWPEFQAMDDTEIQELYSNMSEDRGSNNLLSSGYESYLRRLRNPEKASELFEPGAEEFGIHNDEISEGISSIYNDDNGTPEGSSSIGGAAYDDDEMMQVFGGTGRRSPSPSLICTLNNMKWYLEEPGDNGWSAPREVADISRYVGKCSVDKMGLSGFVNLRIGDYTSERCTMEEVRAVPREEVRLTHHMGTTHIYQMERSGQQADRQEIER